MHRLLKQALWHLFKEGINIELCLLYSLLASVIKWTYFLLISRSNLLIFLFELLAARFIDWIYDMFNEDFLFVQSQLLFLLSKTTLSTHMLLSELRLSLLIVESFFLFIFRFLIVKFPRCAVHNAHQSLLVSSKIDLVWTQDCLEFTFIKLHVIFPG